MHIPLPDPEVVPRQRIRHRWWVWFGWSKWDFLPILKKGEGTKLAAKWHYATKKVAYRNTLESSSQAHQTPQSHHTTTRQCLAKMNQTIHILTDTGLIYDIGTHNEVFLPHSFTPLKSVPTCCTCSSTWTVENYHCTSNNIVLGSAGHSGGEPSLRNTWT